MTAKPITSKGPLYWTTATVHVVLAIVVVWLMFTAGSFLWKHRPGHCVANLQDDLDEAIPEDDPVVEKCNSEDDQGMALCFVRRLENGQPKTRAHWWKCSQRTDAALAKVLINLKPATSE